MRVVFDTNALIAAIVSRGLCHELLEHAARNHELFTSEFILQEFRGKLTGKLKVEDALVAAAEDVLRSKMQVVEPKPPVRSISRDRDDDWILATAVSAPAECLVTGDGDLLELGAHAGIPILSPASFWKFEQADPSRQYD